MSFIVFIEKDGEAVTSGSVELLHATTRHSNSDCVVAHFSHEFGAWVADECFDVAILYLDGYCCGKIRNRATISLMS